MKKPGQKGKRVGRPKGRRTASAPAFVGGGGALAYASNGAARLLSDMHVYHGSLLSQRMSLDAEIDAVAGAMAAMGAVPSGGRGPARAKRGRPLGSGGGRKGSLKEYIVRVLSQQSKPIGPRDIGARILKSGYKTKAKDITKAVSNTLPQVSGVKKVGFGLYQMKA